jgi:hypothetical protein
VDDWEIEVAVDIGARSNVMKGELGGKMFECAGLPVSQRCGHDMSPLSRRALEPAC